MTTYGQATEAAARILRLSKIQADTTKRHQEEIFTPAKKKKANPTATTAEKSAMRNNKEVATAQEAELIDVDRDDDEHDAAPSHLAANFKCGEKLTSEGRRAPKTFASRKEPKTAQSLELFNKKKKLYQGSGTCEPTCCTMACPIIWRPVTLQTR